MREGSIYKRCTTCGGNIDAESRDGSPTKHDRCDGDEWSWAFVVDLAPAGAPRKQRARSGFDTKAEALEAMSDLQQSARAGTVVDPSKLTVSDYLAQWLKAYKAEVRAGTWTAAEGHVRNYIKPRIGDYPLQSLTRTVVRGMYAELRVNGAVRGKDKGLSEKTVHNVHLTLHRALKDAVKDKLIVSNPADSAHKLPTSSRPQIKSWNTDELRVFLGRAAGERLFPLFRLAAYTGMRRGELAGLRWREVDLDAGTVTVSRQRVKTGDGVGVGRPKTKRGERTLDVDPETVRVLREHRKAQLAEQLAAAEWEDSGLVFTAEDGGGLHPDVISQTFDRIVDKLKVVRITFHGLRHTHATIALAQGVPLHVVSRRLGHSSEAFTAQVYGHILPGQQQEAAARFAAAIDG